MTDPRKPVAPKSGAVSATPKKEEEKVEESKKKVVQKPPSNRPKLGEKNG